jgi:peptidoglycan/LPS O-acetylase OafA/YrhL
MKLRTVEFGRGIAACAVVAFHTNATAAYVGLGTNRWTAPLELGVDFFFVLSGFIIFHVHSDDFGRPELALAYLWRRCVRLFPLLWLVAGGWIVLRSVAASAPTMEQIGTSLLLYPSLAEPMPKVVWTLRHEMLFYIAFCVGIINRWLGIALFCGWTLAVLLQMGLIVAGQPIIGLPSMLVSSFVLDFVFGVGVAIISRRWIVRSWWPLIIGIALVVVLSWAKVELSIERDDLLDYTSRANLLVPLIGAGFALCLYGMICIESQVKVPDWAMLLGAASYAIYLVHTPLNSVVQHIAVRLGDGAGHMLLMVSGIGAGIVLHLVFEKPVARLLRRLSPFATQQATVVT